ncbi:hypothetical protein [Henriciella pelagia]|uniref:hypothetical protein n=1 Tax=Henriciella pelagia TaxID=1977912 RepID=UPI003511D37A
MTDSLAQLIERLEAAEGGSRELDAAVFKALDPHGFSLATRQEMVLMPKGATIGDAVRRVRAPAPYTQSLDAALALVEEKLPGAAIEMSIWQKSKDDLSATCWARLMLTHTGEDGKLWHHHSDGRSEAEASTLPLALIIALLKSIQHKEQSDDSSL